MTKTCFFFFLHLEKSRSRRFKKFEEVGPRKYKAKFLSEFVLTIPWLTLLSRTRKSPPNWSRMFGIYAWCVQVFLDNFFIFIFWRPCLFCDVIVRIVFAQAAHRRIVSIARMWGRQSWCTPGDCLWFSNPAPLHRCLFAPKTKKTITISILCILQLLALIDVIIACASAGQFDKGRHKSHGGAFAAIWSMFVIVGLVIGGTYILRTKRSPAYIGILLGASFMTSQLFFTLFVVFTQFAGDEIYSQGNEASEGWFAACAFFISIVTLIFTIVLARYRHEVVATQPSSSFSTSAMQSTRA